MLETNIIEYYCTTCDAGPWGQDVKGGDGQLVYQMHVEMGHKVEIFNPKNHESLKSGVIVGESDFKEPSDEDKEKKLREEMDSILENGRENNSEDWAIQRLAELLVLIDGEVGIPKLKKRLIKWCNRFRYDTKPIKDAIGIVFGDSDNLEKIKKKCFEMGQLDKTIQFDRSQIDEVGYWILGRYYVKRIDLTGDLLFYNDQYYDTRAVSLIRRACRKIFTSSLNRDLSEVQKLIEDVCDVITWEKIEEHVHLKVMKDGVYNIKTGEFSNEFSPDNIVLSQIPHYFMEQPWDDIDNVVSTIISDKNDRESFYDFLSICLHPYNGINFEFGGVGPPGTGKSQLCELAVMVFGHQNVGNAAIHQIAEDPTTQKEMGYKMLNIDADLSGESIRHLDVIKKWVTQDLFTVRGIYQQPTDFRPTSRLLFMANELYEMTNPDDAEAIYERTHLIKIENKFRGSQKEVKSIMKSTVTEDQLNGFLVYLLKNATDIWKNQKIRHPMPFNQVEANWNLFGNRIKEFIEKYIVVDVGEKTEQEEPYNQFLHFALQKGYANKDKKKFRKLFDELMGMSPTMSRFEGEQGRFYQGIRMKTPQEVEREETITIDTTKPKQKKERGLDD